VARMVRIGILQLPFPGEGQPGEVKQRNLHHAISFVDMAGKQGCDVVCLPEIFTTFGLALGTMPEHVPGDATEALAVRAARYHMCIVAPLEVATPHGLRNMAVLIDSAGRIVGSYTKTHLTQLELDAGFLPGEELPVFDLEWGRIGIMICFDNSFPEVARVLALKGAEIIFFPHLQSGYGEAGWFAQLASRAIDNGVYIAPVSFGVEPTEPWMPGMIMGCSGVIGPDGLYVVCAGRAAGAVSAEINLDQRRLVRCFGVLGEADYKKEAFSRRRPHLYQPIAES
jgi:predicted amidohydrolase